MSARVIAHRGCPRHGTENSLAGIRLAAELGADGVEIDVQRTLDGQLFLHHDHTLWRVARVPLPMWLLPARVVYRLAAKRSGALPTFEHALGALPPSLLLAVDIKHPSAGAAVLRAVQARRLQDVVLLWSKSASLCAKLVAEGPGVEVALLRDARGRKALQRFLRDAKPAGTQAISAHWDEARAGFISAAHTRGLKVYAMARNAESQRSKFALGLDGVVTDWPEEALLARDQSSTPGIQ